MKKRLGDTASRRGAAGARRPPGRPAQNGTQAVDEEYLLSLAFRAFAQRGYEGTTLRALSKQLGVSHNLLNVRFGTKAALWRRAVDWRMRVASQVVTEAFDETADDETRLRDLIRRFCFWATQHPDIVGLTNVEGWRSTWRIEYIAEQFVMPFKLRLDGLLARVSQKRPVCKISTAALMALLVQGVGFYFGAVPLQQRIGAGAEIEPSHARAQADVMAAFLLAGLLPDSPRPV